MTVVTTTVMTITVPHSGLLVAVLATHPLGAVLLLRGRPYPHHERGPEAVVVVLRDLETTILVVTASLVALRLLRTVPGRPSSRR
jgi:hypothetical protein